MQSLAQDTGQHVQNHKTNKHNTKYHTNTQYKIPHPCPPSIVVLQNTSMCRLLQPCMNSMINTVSSINTGAQCDLTYYCINTIVNTVIQLYMCIDAI